MQAPLCNWCQARQGTIAGHLIPRICFLESGLPATNSYYEGNILATCRTCNVIWWDWKNPGTLRERWGTDRTASWLRKLRRAVRKAHANGIRVYLSPHADPQIRQKIRRQQWTDPGVERMLWPFYSTYLTCPIPVMAPPENRDAIYLEVIGYFRPQKDVVSLLNHPYFRRVAGWFGGRGRVRLIDLAGEPLATLQQCFVLNEWAIRLLRTWGRRTHAKKKLI